MSRCVGHLYRVLWEERQFVTYHKVLYVNEQIRFVGLSFLFTYPGHSDHDGEEE